jgi:hypothetical protein
MAIINFPTSPADGQQYTAPNGVLYTYSSSVGSWLLANNGGSGGATGTVTSVNVSGGSTGLTFSGGPVTGAGIITAGGILALASGGTGGTTRLSAINNLLPPQTGFNNNFLYTNGTDAGWTPAVTYVDCNGGSTGLTFSGGPVTTSGFFTMAGVLGVANGGTGTTTQAGAANAVLPSQTGQSGNFLTTDGTNVSWAAAGVPATSNAVGTVIFGTFGDQGDAGGYNPPIYPGVNYGGGGVYYSGYATLAGGWYIPGALVNVGTWRTQGYVGGYNSPTGSPGLFRWCQMTLVRIA